MLDFLITPPTYLATYMEEEKRAAEERFRPWQETLSARGIKTTTEVVVGRLHESFVTVMRKSAVDLVTLGFRSHAFTWSSSERLIKGLSVPMLVVRGERAEKARIGSVEIRKILCPTDFSDMSRKALDVAEALQHLFSSDLDVIDSVPSHFIRERLAGDTEAAAEVETQARRDPDALTAQAGIAKQGVMREGEPYREIASFFLTSMGIVRRVYAISGQIFGVRTNLYASTYDEKVGEAFTITPVMRDVALRCGKAFGIEVFGLDVIEDGEDVYVVDVHSFPSFKGVPDASLRLADYIYHACRRVMNGEPVLQAVLTT